jgi:hypothetical protein
MDTAAAAAADFFSKKLKLFAINEKINRNPDTDFVITKLGPAERDFF